MQPRPHNGFTLLELVISLAAATMLMVALSLGLLMVMRSSQTVAAFDDSKADTLRRFLQDDLASATAIDDSVAGSLTVTRPRHDGVIENVSYQVDGDGLSRQVGTQPWEPLDANVTSLIWDQSSYSLTAEQNISNLEAGDLGSLTPSFQAPLISGRERLEVDTAAQSFSIDVPATGKSGDILLVAATAMNCGDIDIQGSGWTEQVDYTSYLWEWQYWQMVNMELRVWTRPWSAALNQVDLDTDYPCWMAAATIILHDVNSATPFSQTTTASGAVTDYWNQPAPLLESQTLGNELNVQIIGGTKRANHRDTLGMVGYSDVVSAISGNYGLRHTLYIVQRQGGLPALTTVSRANMESYTVYVQAGLRIQP